MARFRLGLPYFPNWGEQKKGAGEREMRGGGGGGGLEGGRRIGAVAGGTALILPSVTWTLFGALAVPSHRVIGSVAH